MSETWTVNAGTTTLVRLSDELGNYFKRRGARTPDAEDLLSRTWLAAGRTFGGRSSLRTYLYSIAKRQLAAHFKRREPITLVDRSADADVEEQLAARLTIGEVNSVLHKLPTHYADVVRLALLGHGPGMIARELGIKYNTARTRARRGKAMLMDLLAEQESGTGRTDKSKIR